MPLVIVDPTTLQAAAAVLRQVGDEVASTELRVAPVTTGAHAPGYDVVSVTVERFLVAHTKQYREVSARAWAGIFDEFATSVSAAADSYVTAEENARSSL
ncbi:PE family protein [Mycobacterium haemophilum]|uniref:PE domain-containing protein n=1 Tax=Mycobacterium haemophilum TaxID=29311 RepID=A0A0I9Y4D4_9MYCO|nr:PE family protein [Mycobacterium haemophilum]AKN17409.1 hypothetical protein B586_13810 [Mycobacterium haemophilum DSM 44634]KLO26132.1 hypothetical protein ABH39_18480 [Mycobacterium haemophilum]KLO34507.1 hypothetical protein ABH38_18575 [Mycobacterium haemophilum]KLO37901.1 hypothetical protein ABH37_18870 [Mycobacterium haemophilum]KLO46246.1 hypothetical protein ABH36_18280 [Mycobacterium haemophilum]